MPLTCQGQRIQAFIPGVHLIEHFLVSPELF